MSDLGEQRQSAERALSEGAAVIDVGPFEVIRARGADRVAFLHRLTTGRIAELGPGQGTRSLLLTVKGQPVADLRVCASAEEMRLIVAPGQGVAAAAALSRYAVMDDFTAEVDPQVRLLAVHGPRAESLLRDAGVAVPEGLLAAARWSHADVTGPEGAACFVVREQAAGAPGLWVFGPAVALGGVRSALLAAGAREVPAELAEVLRLRAGEARFGSEINEDYFPMEVGLSAAIDYAKGCFLGQEPIVRIRDRGHLNYRLARLEAAGEGELAPGDRLETDAKPKAGRVTSAARLAGEPAVALAMVHVSVTAGSQVRVRKENAPPGDPAATVAVVSDVPADT